MDNEWILIFSQGEQLDYFDKLYVNPKTETAKLVRSEFVCFRYHDEEDWIDDTTELTIEQALAWVYPNEKAISRILENTKNDYKEVLEHLKAKTDSKKN